jgi:hypothetical protein
MDKKKNPEDYLTTEKTALGIKQTHPSYGTMSFNRVQTNRTCLFGSNIKHHDIIQCTIRNASLTRGLHDDWICGDNEIVTVEMSYSQFAEAITSMNMGTGIPVTLRYVRGDGEIPDCPFKDKREQFAEELSSKLKDASKSTTDIIAECEQIFQKKSIGKGDRETIMNLLNKLKQEVTSNVDFTYSQFNEAMDKTVMQAKGEIESFAQNKINSIAAFAMNNGHIPELTELENPVELTTTKDMEGEIK